MRSPRPAIGVLALSVGVVGAIALVDHRSPSVTTVQSRSGSTSHLSRAVVPQGVEGVSAAQFVARGIYLGPPGIVPTAAIGIRPARPTSTTLVGQQFASTKAAVPVSPEQLAVRGDLADGRATVTANEAKRTALAQAAGFVGPVTSGTPTLVQLDDAYAGVVATAWAIPMRGAVELSDGAEQLSDGAVAPHESGKTQHKSVQVPPVESAVVFIDAVTGHFISEEGFAPS